jgi:hypothetical protein
VKVAHFPFVVFRGILGMMLVLCCASYMLSVVKVD